MIVAFSFCADNPSYFRYSQGRRPRPYHGLAMAPNPSDGLPAYVRLLLLAIAAAIAGALLWAVFPFLPTVVQVLVMLAACVIALRGNFKPDDEKSLASLLVAYIAVFVRICIVCAILWESIRPRSSTRDDAEFRVWFVASCLVAILRLLDGRVSFRDEV